MKKIFFSKSDIKITYFPFTFMFILIVQVPHSYVPATKLYMACGTQSLEVIAVYQYPLMVLATTMQYKYQYTHVIILSVPYTQILVTVLRFLIRRRAV